MARKYVILPCNGLDKAYGPLSREIALVLVEDTGGELICPVLLNSAHARYEKPLSEFPLLVIDGCGTKCASKLANTLNLKIDRKVLVADEARSSALKIEESIAPGPMGLEFARAVATLIAEDMPEDIPEIPIPEFPSPVDYVTFTQDKYIFRVPKDGFLFNENDCWVRVSDKRARVGVSDYVQQKMTDMTYFEPPKVGQTIEQFDEVGTIESVKSSMDLISPVGGTITAVNTALIANPEIINSDPYEKGWVAELELTDFDVDSDLLLDCPAYLDVAKSKAAETH